MFLLLFRGHFAAVVSPGHFSINAVGRRKNVDAELGSPAKTVESTQYLLQCNFAGGNIIEHKIRRIAQSDTLGHNRSRRHQYPFRNFIP
jgi:hypothetical protein